MIDFDSHVAAHYGEWPHPKEPMLKVKDFADAVRLATATKFGGASPDKGHATPHEAALFWKEFQETGLSTDTYMQLLQQMAPLSFRYHGRSPTMREIVMHKDSKPKEMRDYYGSLPHDKFPEMTAHEYTMGRTTADHYSYKHMGRPAHDTEVQLFHAGGHNLQHIEDHYQQLAQARQQKQEQGQDGQR